MVRTSDRVCDITGVKEGKVSVKYQDRVLLCRAGDVRRHLVHTFMVMPILQAGQPTEVIFSFAEALEIGMQVSLLPIFVHGAWRLTRAAERNRDVFEASLHVGIIIIIGVRHCVGIRVLRGRADLPPLTLLDAHEGPIYFYKPPRRGDIGVCYPEHLDKSFKLSRLVGNQDYQLYVFIQFVGVDPKDREDNIREIPNTPLLAGQRQPGPSANADDAWMRPSHHGKRRPEPEADHYLDEGDLPAHANRRLNGSPRDDTPAPPETRQPNCESPEELQAHDDGNDDDEHTGDEGYETAMSLVTFPIPEAKEWTTWVKNDEAYLHEFMAHFMDLLPKPEDDEDTDKWDHVFYSTQGPPILRTTRTSGSVLPQRCPSTQPCEPRHPHHPGSSSSG